MVAAEERVGLPLGRGVHDPNGVTKLAEEGPRGACGTLAVGGCVVASSGKSVLCVGRPSAL